MAWVYLALAGFLEIGWAVGMKLSLGFTRPVPTAATLVLMALSLAFLSLAMRTLPLGTAYAIWTGIGALGTFAVAIVALGEPATAWRIGSAALILAGLVGLKVSAVG